MRCARGEGGNARALHFVRVCVCVCATEDDVIGAFALMWRMEGGERFGDGGDYHFGAAMRRRPRERSRRRVESPNETSALFGVPCYISHGRRYGERDDSEVHGLKNPLLN